MGGHSQCTIATGNSASENPPRFSEMPIASRAIYCQSTPTPNCMPKKAKPWQRAIYKMQLPLVKTPLYKLKITGENRMLEKNIAVSL